MSLDAWERRGREGEWVGGICKDGRVDGWVGGCGREEEGFHCWLVELDG